MKSRYVVILSALLLNGNLYCNESGIQKYLSDKWNALVAYIKEHRKQVVVAIKDKDSHETPEKKRQIQVLRKFMRDADKMTYNKN